MLMALLILGTIATLALIALERDRVWTGLQTVILVLTGGVLIAPLRNALQGIIGPLARFMRAALEYGDAGNASTDSGGSAVVPAPNVDRQTDGSRSEQNGEANRPEPPSTVAAIAPHANHHLNRILAALVLAAITVVLGTFDYEFIHLTFSALWGLPAASDVSVGRTVLTSLALMASLVLWGLIALELGGYTHFMHEFPGALRRTLKYMTIAAFVLGISSALVMGIWRARAMQDVPIEALPAAAVISGSGVIVAEAEPMITLTEDTAGFDSFAPMYLSAAIPVLVLVSSAVSFTGVLWLAKYVAILGLWLCLIPLAVLHFWILPTLDNAIAHLLQAVESLVDILASVGRTLVDTVSPPLRSIRIAIHRRIDKWAGVASDPIAATSAVRPTMPSASSAGPAPESSTSWATSAPATAPSAADTTSQERGESAPAHDLNWEF